jgi:hypothetical protein
MSEFDVQSVAPDGYKVIGYRKILRDEYYINCGGGAARMDFADVSESEYMILKKDKWVPEEDQAFYIVNRDLSTSDHMNITFNEISEYRHSISAGNAFRTRAIAVEASIAIRELLKEFG